MFRNIKKINKLNTSFFKSKFIRKIILIFLDSLAILLAFILISSTEERIANFNFITNPIEITILLLLSIFIYLIGGQYKSFTKYFNSSIIYSVILRNFIVILIFSTFTIFGNKSIFNTISGSIIYFLLASFFSFCFRVLIKNLLKKYNLNEKNIIRKIAIYGAGEAGALLAGSLNIKIHIKLLFFDDNKIMGSQNLWY